MYDHTRYTANANDASLASTGIKHRVFAGVRPLIVRGFCAVITTAPTVTAPVINVKRRPTPGSSSGEVSIGTLTLPVATAIGKSVYKEGFAVRINPGEECVFDCTTAATAGAATLCLDVEESPERLANEADAIASA